MIDHAIISLAVFIGETIGAIIGGGGFIIQPVLMMLNFSIEQAIALCIAASAGTTVSGLMTFNNENKIQWREAAYIIPMSAMGATAGSHILPMLSPVMLSALFLVSAIICTAISWLGNITTQRESQASIFSSAAAAFFSGVIIALIGAGSGILSLMLIIHLGKRSYISALILRKFIFLPATTVAIIQYTRLGLYTPDMFLLVFCSALVAGWAGAKIALSLNNKLLTTIFRIATLMLVIGTLRKQFM